MKAELPVLAAQLCSRKLHPLQAGTERRMRKDIQIVASCMARTSFDVELSVTDLLEGAFNRKRGEGQLEAEKMDLVSTPTTPSTSNVCSTPEGEGRGPALSEAMRIAKGANEIPVHNGNKPSIKLRSADQEDGAVLQFN